MGFEAGAGEGDTRLEGCNRYRGCQHHQRSIGSGFPLLSFNPLSRDRDTKPDSVSATIGHAAKTQKLWQAGNLFCPDKESERAEKDLKRMFVFRKVLHFHTKRSSRQLSNKV